MIKRSNPSHRTRKKKIQINILIRIILSTIAAAGFNNMLIYLSIDVFKAWDQAWFRNSLPYVITPIFILTFILTFLFLTRRMVKDIIHLEQGLQFISEGNLDYRVPVNRQDELGRVASNINHMTEQLQLQMVKERELEKSKMDMITGISHDLRTPLTSIIGYIELLRTESFQDKAEYDRFIQNTYNKATHLKKLLDDLFEYTRLTSVDMRLDLRKVDLYQLLDQLLFEFEPLAQENGIHIEKEIGDSPIMACVDSDKIARAIDNLLMNALKYSLKPGAIHIRMSMRNDHITIKVENKGAPLTIEQKISCLIAFIRLIIQEAAKAFKRGLVWVFRLQEILRSYIRVP